MGATATDYSVKQKHTNKSVVSSNKTGAGFRTLDQFLELRKLVDNVWLPRIKHKLAMMLIEWAVRARIHPVQIAELMETMQWDEEHDLERVLTTIHDRYKKAYGEIPELSNLDNYARELWNRGEIDINVYGIESLNISLSPNDSILKLLSEAIDRSRALYILYSIEKMFGVASPFNDPLFADVDLEEGLCIVVDPIIEEVYVARIHRKNQEIKYKRSVLEGFPRKIVVYENPLGGTTKYEVVWEAKTRSRPITIGPEYVDEVIDELKAEGLVKNKRNIEDVMSNIVNTFIKKGRAEIETSIESPGFYIVDEEIVVSGYDVKKQLRPEDVKKALLLFNELVADWYKHVQDRFVTIIKWGIIAPFIFAVKQLDGWVPMPYLYGPPDTGKTTMGAIVDRIWGQEVRIEGGSAIDTKARLGHVLEESTFPAIYNETGVILKDPGIREMIKSSIESTYSRGRYYRGKYRRQLALRPLIFTSNYAPPNDKALIKRLIAMRFYPSETIPPERKKEFEKQVVPRLKDLKPLGDFVAYTIVNNPEWIHKIKDNWVEASTELLKQAYRYAGLEVPKWIDLYYEGYSPEEFEEEIIEDIRSFLVDKINDAYARNVGRVGVEIPLNELGEDATIRQGTVPRSEVPFEEKVRIVVNNRLIPWLIPKGEDKIVITSSIISEMKRKNILVEGYDNLKALAQLLGWGDRYKPVRIANKVVKGIIISINDLVSFLSLEQ